MRPIASILRHLAAFAVLLQMALPYAQAHAAANGVDLADLICNPSGQAISTEAQAALDAKNKQKAWYQKRSDDDETNRLQAEVAARAMIDDEPW